MPNEDGQLDFWLQINQRSRSQLERQEMGTENGGALSSEKLHHLKWYLWPSGSYLLLCAYIYIYVCVCVYIYIYIYIRYIYIKYIYTYIYIYI